MTVLYTVKLQISDGKKNKITFKNMPLLINSLTKHADKSTFCHFKQ